MPSIEWIEYDEVLALHQYTIAEYGGSNGLRSKDLLSSGLNKPRTYYFYKEIKDLYVLASLYSQGIACNHPFVDANKRTSFLTADFFLRKNEIEVKDFDTDRIVEMTIALTQQVIDYNEYADFLKNG